MQRWPTLTDLIAYITQPGAAGQIGESLLLARTEEYAMVRRSWCSSRLRGSQASAPTCSTQWACRFGRSTPASPSLPGTPPALLDLRSDAGTRSFTKTLSRFQKKVPLTQPLCLYLVPPGRKRSHCQYLKGQQHCMAMQDEGGAAIQGRAPGSAVHERRLCSRG